MRLLSRQSWNPLALIATARTLIRRPGLLVPHVAVRNVDELNYDALRAAGVASIIFDKDNTLTKPYELGLHPAAAAGLRAGPHRGGITADFGIQIRSFQQMLEIIYKICGHAT